MESHMFSSIRLAVTGLLLTALAACSTTPESRIGKQQSTFDGYPAEVQQKIRAGEVAVGFTPEQVRLALGEPSNVTVQQTDKGEAEIWAYRESSPAFSFGVGGFSGGSTSVGGGVGVGTGGDRNEDRIRVRFEAGRVAAIEQARSN